MFEGLDQIDWASMYHAYGSAEGVPELLRQLVSHDPGERELALDGLYGAVHHQGDIYECTIACLPFLLEAVGNPNVPDRGEILELLASIGGADTPVFDYHQDEANDLDSDDHAQSLKHARIAHEAVLAKHNMFLALLLDPDPAVRRKVPKVLSACWEQAPRIVLALQSRLISETDQQSRIQLIEVLGALVDRAARGHVDREAISSWLVERLTADADPAVRLSALVQIARQSPARLPSDIVAMVLDILEAADGDASPSAGESTAHAATERANPASTAVPAPKTLVGMLRQIGAMRNEGRCAPWVGDLLPQLHSALGDRVLDRLQLIMALLQAPQWEWRSDGTRSAGVLIQGWRGPYTELVALLGEQVADPTSRLCDLAILALTHVELGRLAAPAADGLARYLEIAERITGPQLGPPPGWIEVLSPGTAGYIGPVLKTLAALGDPRAVPALTWVLERERLPENTGFVLASLGQEAAQFTPAMIRWLRHLPVVRGWDQSRAGLLLALGRLGPAAAPAIPDLVELLGNEQIASSAARALGLIGPQAEVAVPLLHELLSHSTAAIAIAVAQALYRIDGDVASTLLTLKRYLAHESQSKVQAADCTAELGVAAAPLVPQLRALLTDSSPMVRVRAAAALWAVTADTGASLPVLLADWEDCPFVRLHAARCIVQMGSTAQAAIPFLQGELARVRRHTYRPNGWGSHDIVEDEALREACAVAVSRIMAQR